MINILHHCKSPPLKVLLPASAIMQKDVQVSGCQAGNTKLSTLSSLKQAIDESAEWERYLHDTSEGYLTKGPCMAPPVLGSCLSVLSAAFVLRPVAVMGWPVGQWLKLDQGHKQAELWTIIRIMLWDHCQMITKPYHKCSVRLESWSLHTGWFYHGFPGECRQ